MWFLVHNDTHFWITPGKEHIIGRKECDILLAEDRSISRKHAIVSVVIKDSQERLFIKDCDSKFGTAVNQQKLPPNVEAFLQHGDKLFLGTMTEMGVVSKQVLPCLSGMDQATKAHLQTIIQHLGIQASNQWNESCTHLVLDSQKVTEKLLCALMEVKPVVTSNWLQALKNADLKNFKFPSEAEFVSQCTLEGEASFGQIDSRRTLFHDREFFFFAQEPLEKWRMLIERGQGKVSLVDQRESAVTSSITRCVSEQKIPCFVAPPDKKAVERLSPLLNSHDFGWVQESDISYAILSASVTTHCNPRPPAKKPKISPPRKSEPAKEAPRDLPPKSEPPSRAKDLPPKDVIDITELTEAKGVPPKPKEAMTVDPERKNRILEMMTKFDESRRTLNSSSQRLMAKPPTPVPSVNPVKDVEEVPLPKPRTSGNLMILDPRSAGKGPAAQSPKKQKIVALDDDNEGSLGSAPQPPRPSLRETVKEGEFLGGKKSISLGSVSSMEDDDAVPLVSEKSKPPEPTPPPLHILTRTSPKKKTPGSDRQPVNTIKIDIQDCELKKRSTYASQNVEDRELSGGMVQEVRALFCKRAKVYAVQQTASGDPNFKRFRKTVHLYQRALNGDSRHAVDDSQKSSIIPPKTTIGRKRGARVLEDDSDD